MLPHPLTMPMAAARFLDGHDHVSTPEEWRFNQHTLEAEGWSSIPIQGSVQTLDVKHYDYGI